MATANNPRVIWMTCKICGERWDQAETAAIWRACRKCVRSLWTLINDLPGEVSPAVTAYLEKMSV